MAQNTTFSFHKKCFLLSICLLSAAHISPSYAFDFRLKDPLFTKKSLHSQKNQPSSCPTLLPANKPLTLTEAVTFALCHNPATKESFGNVLTSAAQFGSSRSAYLPTIEGAAGRGRTETDTSATKSSTDASSSSSVSLNYLLLDFGGRSAVYRATKEALIAADYTHSASLQNVLFSTIDAYYQLYSAQSAVDAATENVRSSKVAFDAASLRYEVGAATIADKLLAETAYAQALLKQELADNQTRLRKGTLASTMGIPPYTPFIITPNNPKELSSDMKADVISLLEEAKRARPDLAASNAQLASAKASLRKERSLGLPTLSLNASRDYGYTDSTNLDTNRGTVGLTVHVPIFSGFDRTYQIRAAEGALATQKARRDKAEDAVLLDVWSSYNNFQTAQETFRMTKTLLASAQKAQQVAEGRYKAGAGSITDLLNAVGQLANARQEYVQAQYSILISKADLLRAIGRLDTTMIKE